MSTYRTDEWFAREEEQPSSTLSWLSLLAGSGLAVFGASRKSLPGAALAAGGGYLVFRGVRDLRTGSDQEVEVEKSLTIMKSPEELYSFWRDFENLPQFMYHLEDVQVMNDRRSHWVAKAPAGQSVEWDALITDDIPNSLISWESLPGAQVPNAGVVNFIPAPGGRGTVVRVEIEYRPPAGPIGRIVSMLFGEEPGQQVGGDLRRFKNVMETGEVIRSDGSPHGTGQKGQRPAQPLTEQKYEQVLHEEIEPQAEREAMHQW